ncbi:MAG: hydrogen peroxide-inducible genes activator [Deltaproteobacteria bacterium]|nr:MAG: hydrogen peroxide-inducible genes activator [Deltaproteobacteria bacterium]
MRNHDFTLRQLQYAVAVADTQGFRRAAELCGVSQPSLSAQIQRLEAALGVALFERHARKTLLTPEGRDLIESMREVLRSADRLEQTAAARLDPYSVPLRVGVIPTIAPYLLPRIIPRMGEQGRGLKVHWLELQTRDCRSALSEGEIDAMVIADPAISPATETVEVGWEPFYMVGGLGTLPEGRIPLDDIDADRLMLLEEGHCLREHTLSLCHLSASVTSPFRGTSLPTVVQMAAAGLGQTVIPASALMREADGRTLDIRRFRGQIGRMVRLIWRSRNPRHELMTELGSCLEGALAAAVDEAEVFARQSLAG